MSLGNSGMGDMMQTVFSFESASEALVSDVKTSLDVSSILKGAIYGDRVLEIPSPENIRFLILSSVSEGSRVVS